MDLDLAFQGEDQHLDNLYAFGGQQLERISNITKQMVQDGASQKLNFQQILHLEVRIQETRQKLLNCNLALAQCIIILDSRISQLKSNPINKQAFNEQQDIGCFRAGQQTEYSFHRQNWMNETKYSMQSFKKILTIRQVQLTMIMFIIQFRNKDNFKEIYLKNFGQIGQFIIKPQDCYKKINIFILDDLFKKQLEYLTSYYKEINNLLSFSQKFDQKQVFEQIQTIINRIKIESAKIKTISEIFPYACIKEHDDLFSIKQLHPRWQKLIGNEIIQYISLSDKMTLEHSFNDLKENLNIINAAMSIIDRHKLQNNKSLNQKMKVFYSMSINILKCAISKKQARFEAEVMFSQGKQHLAKQIWNLPENKMLRQFIELSLPSIAYSQVLYIPRTYRQFFYSNLQQNTVKLPEKSIQNIEKYCQQLLIKKKYDQSIRVRVNYCGKLQQKNNKKQDTSKKSKQSFINNLSIGMSEFVGNVSKIFKAQQKSPNALIFHIHGGGFISLSSFIHQIYIRKWANNIKVPIVSVDYGKAPERPYPQGLYDCFQAYMWTINAFKTIYKLEPQKIIIVGDSAGGNLAAALTILLIRWKLPIPSGLVLVYPALNLDTANYTPSLLTALNDMILPHTFLKVCARAYLKQYSKHASTDALISPSLASDQVLSLFPKTEIFVGNKDPFHDECCRFIERLSNKCPNKCHLTILDQFPHGFLQFDAKLMPNQFGRQATKIVEKCLASMIL